MAGEPGIPYKADTGGGTSNAPDLRAPLGAPNILRPEDFIAMANFNDPTVALKNAYDLTSSLIDNHYNNQIKLAKSAADLSETAARTGQYQAQTDNIQSESDQRKQQLPLLLKQDSQRIQQNDYALKEAQRQSDTLDKALSEYGQWNSELSALDPTDPDYDDKVAAINAKYPEASTNPRTQSLITPMLTEHNLKRNQDFQVQLRNRQMNELQGYQKPKDPNDPNSGLLDPSIDIRAEAKAGGPAQLQSLINQAKSQAAINRLQRIAALGTSGDRSWAQGEIGAISGKALGPGETPDRTMFGPNGDLNTGTDLVLSRIESRLGITPVAPGAKKEIKTTVDETTGQPKTETTITGMPVTQADINAQKTQTPSAIQGPTKPEDWAKDPSFQSVMQDIASKKFVPPGDPMSPGYQAAVTAEITKRKAAAAGGQQPAQPGATPTPNTSQANPATDLSSSRAQIAQELSNNPDLRRKLMASTDAEVGDQDDRAKQAYIESVMNRAAARNLSLDSTISSLHDPRTDTGYYPLSTISKLGRTPSRAVQANLNPIIDRVLAGSNLSNFATGNESGNVHSGGAEVAFNPGTGERFVVENDDADWVARARGRTQHPTAQAPNHALPKPASIAEARALPRGSHFLDPDGNRRMVA